VGTKVLTMRKAPCSTAHAVRHHGHDLTLPPGATFEYLDRNSRQSESCASYGLAEDAQQAASYCWVLGQYKGASGWVPVQRLENDPDTGTPWSSALCTYKLVGGRNVPELLVSDDGSVTGCAELTPDLQQGRAIECFPAEASVTLRGSSRISMSQLQLGDEVAVRRADGSVGWSAVYAFGHRDDTTPAEFVEITGTTQGAGAVTSSIQVGLHHVKYTPGQAMAVHPVQPANELGVAVHCGPGVLAACWSNTPEVQKCIAGDVDHSQSWVIPPD
jgi:hypothetical protein